MAFLLDMNFKYSKCKLEISVLRISTTGFADEEIVKARFGSVYANIFVAFYDSEDQPLVNAIIEYNLTDFLEVLNYLNCTLVTELNDNDIDVGKKTSTIVPTDTSETLKSASIIKGIVYGKCPADGGIAIYLLPLDAIADGCRYYQFIININADVIKEEAYASDSGPALSLRVSSENITKFIEDIYEDIEVARKNTAQLAGMSLVPTFTAK